MSLWQSLLRKLGLKSVRAERHPIRVFLLDDDERRHRWFTTRFKGDFIDIANNVTEAQQLLSAGSYDAIFLDHDLHPEHYNAESTDDERTGYAVAALALFKSGTATRLDNSGSHAECGRRDANGRRVEARRPQRGLRSFSACWRNGLKVIGVVKLTVI